MSGRQYKCGRVSACASMLLAAGFAVLGAVSAARASGAAEAFAPMTMIVSGEGTIVRFSSNRLNGGFINAWNVGARFSLLPFGVIHIPVGTRMLDGAIEVGLEPTFERFNTQNQNFVGVLAEARYHFVNLGYGPFVPWIGGGIGPGYSDLDIGTVHGDSKLTGPFMAMIKGEIGVSCFIDSRRLVYVGLEAQHFSNSELNGRDGISTTNQSLNTPWGMVVGFSWFFR